MYVCACACICVQALSHIHKNNLLHLDIKPANVLVGQGGVLKLGDFGQARLKFDVGDGNEGETQYMAPELLGSADKSPPTSAADIFSLGLMLFELATGMDLPTSGAMWHELREGKAKRMAQLHSQPYANYYVACTMCLLYVFVRLCVHIHLLFHMYYCVNTCMYMHICMRLCM